MKVNDEGAISRQQIRKDDSSLSSRLRVSFFFLRHSPVRSASFRTISAPGNGRLSDWHQRERGQECRTGNHTLCDMPGQETEKQRSQ